MKAHHVKPLVLEHAPPGGDTWATTVEDDFVFQTYTMGSQR